MLPEPIAATARVTAVLETLGVPYFIGDSDVIAKLRPEHIRPFVQAMQGEFYVDEEMITNAVANRSSFNIIHRESMFKVDVFIPRELPFIKNQFARARRELLSSDPVVQAYVSTAEDILLAKLEWFRMGGETSERQWRDVLGVLKVQAGTLDLDYLRRTAIEINAEDLLERALKAT
jgi:hypothetical protein